MKYIIITKNHAVMFPTYEELMHCFAKFRSCGIPCLFKITSF